MNRDKVVELKQELARIAQDICNEIGGGEVSINIKTSTTQDLMCRKTTVVSHVSVSINEEI